MGTEIKTKLERYSVKKSWGGDENGSSISILCIDDSKFRDPNSTQQEGYIRLDMVEAYYLACTLIDFVKKTAEVRQGYLEDNIKNLKHFQRTVFEEIGTLELETLGLKSPAEFSVELIDKFYPKAPKR